jgi:hypothetical protein
LIGKVYIFKKLDHGLDDLPILTIKPKKVRRKEIKGTRIIFDESGNSFNPYELQNLDDFKGDMNSLATEHFEINKEALKVADVEDKINEKLKVYFINL